MARVTVTEIVKGDNLLITAPNATLLSWTNQSGHVDEENVATEGIDGRNLVLRSVHADQFTAATQVFSATGTAVITAAAPTVATVGATVEIGPFTYTSAVAPLSDFEVTCSFEVTDFGLLFGTMHFQLYESKDNKVTWSAMTTSIRKSTTEASPGFTKSVTIVEMLTGVYNTTHLWFRLYAWEPDLGIDFTIGHVEFFTERRMK